MRFIITIIAIFVILILGILIFSHHGNKPTPIHVKKLADFAFTDADMRFTTDGIINGDDVHRQIVITVGQNDRTIQIIQGYQGHVINSESLDNNSSAYAAFLSALDIAGFTKKHDSKYSSEVGLCPLAFRYVYEITNNDDGDLRTWSTDCGQGTFGGNFGTVQALFQNQITNYVDFTNNVNLN